MQAITPTHIIWLKRHLDLYSFNDERGQALRDSILAYDEKKQNRHQAELIYEEFLKLFSNNMFYYGFKKTKQSVTSDQLDAYLVYNKYNALTPIGLMREVRGDIEYPYDKAKCEYENAFKEQEKQLRAVGSGSKKRKFFDNVTWRQKPMLFRALIALALLIVVGVKLFLSRNIIIDEVKNGGLVGKIIWIFVGILVLAGFISFLGEVYGVIKWFRYNRALKWANKCMDDFRDEMDEKTNRRGMSGAEERDREMVDDWLNDFRVQVDEEFEQPLQEEQISQHRTEFAGPRNAIVWRETDKYQVKLVETMGRDDRTLPLADRSFAAQKRECDRNIAGIKRMWKKGASWKKHFGVGAYAVLILSGVFLFLCVGKIDYCRVISEGFTDSFLSNDEKIKIPDSNAEDENGEQKQEVEKKSADKYAEPGCERIKIKSAEASSEKKDNPVRYAMDGDYLTCWQEDKEGEGVTESITFTFDGVKNLAYFTMCNGNAASGAEYNMSSRVRTVRIEFILEGMTKNVSTIDINDEWKQEETIYRLPRATECDRVKVYIGSVYSGTLNKDTSISEIGFYEMVEEN